MSPARWKALPSVAMAGATIISACCNSRMLSAPHIPMQTRSAPTRFCVPSVRLVGPKEQLIQGPLGAGLYSGAPGQGRVRRGHAPVEPFAGSFFRLSKGRAYHHCVGARYYRFAQVAAGANAAVGDYRYVSSCGVGSTRPWQRRSPQVAVTWGTPTPVTSRVVHAAPGSYANQDGRYASFHELYAGAIGNAVAHHHRRIDLLYEFGED